MECVLVTGLDVVEEKKKGPKPSTAKGIEKAGVGSLHTNYKLMVPEHLHILAVAASQDPDLLLDEEDDDEADGEDEERHVRPRPSQPLGAAVAPPNTLPPAPRPEAPVLFRVSPSAAAPLVPTAAMAVRPPPYNHQAYMEGGDYSDDEDELMA